MYVPSSFSVSDPEVVARFIEANAFATLVTQIDDEPFATHVPLFLDRSTGGNGVLLGHVARANPHWKAFDGVRKALAIFHGPHAHVSPSWYANHPAVPTWNYTAVHAYGSPRVVDAEALEKIVDRLTAIYETAPLELPSEFKSNLLKAIVGFEMPIERIEVKFKLSQNRPAEDRARVRERLAASTDPQARALAEMMEV